MSDIAEMLASAKAQGYEEGIDDSIRVFTEIAEMCGMGRTFIRRVGMKMEQLKEQTE